MQSKNPFLDDLARLMTSAAGVAQNARSEMENTFKSILDRWLVDNNFVTREEFESVRAMAQKAREENIMLSERLHLLEKTIGSPKTETKKTNRVKKIPTK